LRRRGQVSYSVVVNDEPNFVLRAIERTGLNQTELARVLGKPPRSVGRWARLETPPARMSMVLILALGRALENEPALRRLIASQKRSPPPGQWCREWADDDGGRVNEYLFWSRIFTAAV